MAQPVTIDALHEEAAASYRHPWLLTGGAIVAAALWLLLWLGWEIWEGEGFGFDRAIMLAMRLPGHPDTPGGPAWLASTMRDVTALGSSVVLTALVTVCASFLLVRGLRRSALLLVIATISGSIVITIIKALIARSRPDIVTQLMIETSHSFPSGHAANSAIVYLTLASLLFPILRGPRERLFVLATMMLLVAAIGISRVYLGVHWPSDVLAGWVFGSLWALAWWRIELWLLPTPSVQTKTRSTSPPH